ncbi:MAG: hypothetical protein WAL79_10970, partial [Nitrososphaeraceae archaeon]
HRIRCTLTYSWWIHGTIHKRAADGICSRTQPNGKNGNGRLSRVIVIVQAEIEIVIVIVIASITAPEHQHQ